MRIIHTCLRYPPALGGVETYVQQLVERTRDISQNRDVRVLTSRLKTHGPLSELSPDSLLVDSLYVQRLHHATTPFISYPRLQALKYYLGHHKPAIIHGYSFWYQPADVAARYAKKHRVPFIFHPMYYENEIRQKPLWQLYKNTIGRQTFAAADVVAVISPYEQSLIEKAGFPVKRFVLLPPGVDTTALAQSNIQSPFAERQISGKIMLAVSRIAAGKGLDSVIKALPAIRRQVPDAQLVIIGEDFGAEAQLKALVEQTGTADSVHWLGAVDDQTLRAAYQHADIFVHPTHYEAFGIVLAEASAAGLPVVTRNVAATPYVVKDGQTGCLFTTEDELVTSVIQLFQNDAQRAEFGAAGKKYIHENFTWDRTIKKLLELYGELL